MSLADQSAARILIADDEAPARSRLRDLLDDCRPRFPLAIVDEARSGREALDVLAVAEGPAADLARRFVLGYVSYGLGRVGSVVREARDVDRIMAFGFNWAPPGLLADLLGHKRTVALLERADRPVPAALVDAIERRQPLFAEPHVERGRFFFAGGGQ